ncbi:hypothetical protein ACT3RU_16110 [Halomonas sp. TP35]
MQKPYQPPVAQRFISWPGCILVSALLESLNLLLFGVLPRRFASDHLASIFLSILPLCA